MGFFPPVYFWQNRQEKKNWGDILERKNAFLEYKKRCKKNRKIGLLKKGLVHGFDQKMGFFPPFYFWQNTGTKNCLATF